MKLKDIARKGRKEGVGLNYEIKLNGEEYSDLKVMAYFYLGGALLFFMYFYAFSLYAIWVLSFTILAFISLNVFALYHAFGIIRDGVAYHYKLKAIDEFKEYFDYDFMKRATEKYYKEKYK